MLPTSIRKGLQRFASKTVRGWLLVSFSSYLWVAPLTYYGAAGFFFIVYPSFFCLITHFIFFLVLYKASFNSAGIMEHWPNAKLCAGYQGQEDEPRRHGLGAQRAHRSPGGRDGCQINKWINTISSHGEKCLLCGFYYITIFKHIFVAFVLLCRDATDPIAPQRELLLCGF